MDQNTISSIMEHPVARRNTFTANFRHHIIFVLLRLRTNYMSRLKNALCFRCMCSTVDIFLGREETLITCQNRGHPKWGS